MEGSIPLARSNRNEERRFRAGSRGRSLNFARCRSIMIVRMTRSLGEKMIAIPPSALAIGKKADVESLILGARGVRVAAAVVFQMARAKVEAPVTEGEYPPSSERPYVKIGRIPDIPALSHGLTGPRPGVLALWSTAVNVWSWPCENLQRAPRTHRARRLVNEFYIRFFRMGAHWRDRDHFFPTRAPVMRTSMIDRHRAKGCTERPRDPARKPGRFVCEWSGQRDAPLHRSRARTGTLER